MQNLIQEESATHVTDTGPASKTTGHNKIGGEKKHYPTKKLMSAMKCTTLVSVGEDMKISIHHKIRCDKSLKQEEITKQYADGG